MYGLVNQAIKTYFVNKHGDEAWQRIRALAQCDNEFLSMKQYPDEVSSRLIDLISSSEGRTGDLLLEDVGQSFMDLVASTGYAGLLDALGATLPAALSNLDVLHARVGQTFPNLRAPSFKCTDITDTSLRLHYYSPRGGFTHLVVGLVRALGNRLQTDVSIVIAEAASRGADHDIFEVSYVAR